MLLCPARGDGKNGQRPIRKTNSGNELCQSGYFNGNQIVDLYEGE